jgi:hypothetical protein
MVGVNSDEFVELVFKKMGHHSQAFVQTGPLELTRSDGAPCYLDNAYQEYHAVSPNKRDELLALYVRVFTTMDAKAVDVRPSDKRSLIPVVRNRADYEFCTEPAVHRVLATDLAIGVVVDRPDVMTYLLPTDRDELGLSVDGAVEAATENLRNRSNKDFCRIRKGTYVSAFGDDYDSSRLLLLDRIAKLPVKGRHVAAVPNRNTLVITGSDDIAGLRYMAEICQRAEHQPRFVTGRILQFSHDGWLPWLPPEGNYYRPAFLGLRARSAGQDYDEQIEWLATNEKTNTGAFRAPFMVFQGSCKSLSVLTRQACPTSLPETDLVVFCDAEHPGFVLGLCDWDAFAWSMGDALKAEGCWPERYLVSDFPTPEQLSAMKLRSLETELGPRSVERPS